MDQQRFDSLLEPFDPTVCRTLRRNLKRWFSRNSRKLPWRETRDPYCIWISEIMLQQTTVKAVIPYYERFLSRFPGVRELADASETEVLQYWEGLGYYSRGRNLRLAAQIICDQFNGEFPHDLELLQSLPGIGRYTAGAIRSFAFDLPAPIVEANTQRLYCRLLGYAGDPRNQFGQKLLWTFAEQLQPARSSGHINQALMELGSLVCTPKSPRCTECPARRFCVAFTEARQDDIPRPKERPEITPLVEATVAIQSGNRYLVRQRRPDERWAGMWDFIRFPIDTITPRQRLTKNIAKQIHSRVIDEVRHTLCVDITAPEIMTEIRHSVTRYRIRLICLRAEIEDCSAAQLETNESRLKWMTLAEMEDLPMPVSGRRYVKILKEE